MRTGVESAITRLMGTRSGARVVKGRERDHATRLDSSKNGVTRKSMLVESARSGDGVKNERLKTERQKDRVRSHDRRPPTPSPSHPSYTFSSIARRILAPYISRPERERYGRHEQNETKQNNSTTFFTILLLLSSSHSPNYTTHDRNNRSPSHGLISPNASHSNFLLVAITGQLASNAALLLDRFNAHQISTTTTTRVT